MHTKYNEIIGNHGADRIFLAGVEVDRIHPRLKLFHMIWFICNQSKVQERVKFFGLIFPGFRIAELIRLDTTKFIDLFTKTSQWNIPLASKTAIDEEHQKKKNEERKSLFYSSLKYIFISRTNTPLDNDVATETFSLKRTIERNRK